MKNIRVALCFLDDNGDIVSKKILNDKWQLDIEEDENYSGRVVKEIVSILTDHVVQSIDKEVICELIDNLKEGE